MDGGWIGRIRGRERIMQARRRFEAAPDEAPDELVSRWMAYQRARRRERLFGDGSGEKLTVLAITGAGVLFFAWGLGRFLFADYHCGGPECRAMEAALNRSAISAFVGLGCVVLSVVVDGRWDTGFAFRCALLLAAAAGVCGLVALASLAVGAFLFPLDMFLRLLLFPFPVVALLLLVFPVWLVVWRSGW